MNRYLNSNPAHIEFLDMARLDVGFMANFFAMKVEDVAAVPGTAATRAKFAVHEAISRLERLAKDTSKTDDAKHEAAKTLFQNVKREVAPSIDAIRRYGDHEAEAAKTQALAVLAPNPAKAAVYSEIRAYCFNRRADPDFPAELAMMVRKNVEVARALNDGFGFLAGVSDARHSHLIGDALEAFAPEHIAHMNHAIAVGNEADRMENGLRKLEQAMFASALADRATASRVDVNAPLVATASE
jgi:hypothetical protein